jgi:hypothetical protein
MVFFAISRKGYEDFLAMNLNAILWSTLGVIEIHELELLRAKGVSTSVFNYQVASDNIAAICGAVETIREHHPGQTVWLST